MPEDGRDRTMFLAEDVSLARRYEYGRHLPNRNLPRRQTAVVAAAVAAVAKSDNCFRGTPLSRVYHIFIKSRRHIFITIIRAPLQPAEVAGNFRRGSRGTRYPRCEIRDTIATRRPI